MFGDINKPGGHHWCSVAWNTICWDCNPDDNHNDGKEIRIKYLTTKFRSINEMDEIRVEKTVILVWSTDSCEELQKRQI